MVVQAPLQEGEETSFQGWGWDGRQETVWPDLRVSWSERRPFEPARRDIPSLLALRSPDAELEGVLRVLSVQLETRDGPGPVLPVDGIMDVEGILTIRGRELSVRGVLRHRQP